MSPAPSISARDRRAILVGALIVLPALFFVWGVRPFLSSLDDARDLLAAERGALARERAAVLAAERNPELQRLADSLVRAVSPRLFAGQDDVIATAELVSHLGVIAEQSDVWLQTASTRPALIGASGVRTLQVELRAESDLRGVLAFLQALERGAKLVRVERLDVSVAPGTFTDDGVEPVSVSATVVGYALPAGTTP